MVPPGTLTLGTLLPDGEPPIEPDGIPVSDESGPDELVEEPEALAPEEARPEVAVVVPKPGGPTPALPKELGALTVAQK